MANAQCDLSQRRGKGQNSLCQNPVTKDTADVREVLCPLEDWGGMSQVCTASTKPGHAGWAGSTARCGTKDCLLKQSLDTQDEPQRCMLHGVEQRAVC